MEKFLSATRRFLRDEEGVTAIEYGLIAALIAQTREHGASLVLVTHSEAAAGRADRVLHLSAEGISA